MAQARIQLKDKEESPNYKAPRVNFSFSDFEIIGRLGDGSFSTVILARYKPTGREYALKIVNKSLVMRNKMVDYIVNERNILDQLDYDGVAKLYFTFQDADSLYLGMEYCPGGELYDQLQKRGTLPLGDARFYAAEIVQILEYLRQKEVVHRDLKPENLLLGADGHLKLADFGSAKAFFLPPTARREGARNRATSFVGTAEYVSPEVLQNTGVTYAADLWALGCIIFQLLTGVPPFKGASEYLTFQKITARDLQFPANFPTAARDLVSRLLELEPRHRLGYGDIDEVKRHAFFQGVDWASLRSQAAPAFEPPKPPSSQDGGLDWELTSMRHEAGGDIVYELPGTQG